MTPTTDESEELTTMCGFMKGPWHDPWVYHGWTQSFMPSRSWAPCIHICEQWGLIPPTFCLFIYFIKYSSHLLFIILKEYVRVKTQKDKVKYHYFSSMKGIYHGTTWTDCNFIWLYHPLMIHNLPYNIITSIKILIGTTQRAQKKKEVIIDVIIWPWNASILDNSLIKRQEKNDYNDATKKHFNYNCIP